MFKNILQSRKKIAPFNGPARDLHILDKPLWLWQCDALAKYTDREIELPLHSVPMRLISGVLAILR
jgi:hypothetical protein